MSKPQNPNRSDENLAESKGRILGILFPGFEGRKYVSDRSPSKLRKLDDEDLFKKTNQAVGDKSQLSIIGYLMPREGQKIKISKDHQNKLISALCFIYGFEFFESVGVSAIAKKLDNTDVFEGQNRFANIYDVFAYLKRADEMMSLSSHGTTNFDQKTLNLKSLNSPTPFRLQYTLRDSCRSLLLADFGTYSDFLRNMERGSQDAAAISKISTAIVQNYYFGGKEDLRSGRLGVDQLNILERAIFTLIAIEPRRNPASVILNAMAFDLIAGGKKWSDLIAPKTDKKRSASTRDAKEIMPDGCAQIPMTARDAVKISEHINITFKEFLAEGEHSNYGSIKTSTSEDELKSFIESQANFFKYWVDFKHDQLSEDESENFRGLKTALNQVKTFGDNGIPQAEIGMAADSYESLIQEFLAYFYKDISLSQCTDCKFLSPENLTTETKEKTIEFSEEEYANKKLRHLLFPDIDLESVGGTTSVETTSDDYTTNTNSLTTASAVAVSRSQRDIDGQGKN